MSVFERATEKLAALMTGDPNPTIDALADTVTYKDNDGRWYGKITVDSGAYYRDAERILEPLFESIDWNRVSYEALGRHLALNHENEYPCGECLLAVVTTRETFPRDW